MARQTLIHLHTGNANNTPALTGETAIQLGEIAVNYADGRERLTIKNAADELVEFLSHEQITSEINEAVSDGVALSGAATDSITTTFAGKTISANLNVSVAEGNAITVSAAGVFVEDKTEDIAANAAAIEAEETRATGVEASLRSDLNTVSGKADTNASAIAANTEAIEAEASARTQADNALQTAINGKVSAVTAADASIVIGGTATAPSVKVQLDDAEGNAITMGAKGIRVDIPEEVPYTGTDAIKVTDHEISLDIDPNDKVLTQSTDGLRVNLSLNFNNTTGEITLQGNGQALSTIDLPVESILKSAEVTDEAATTAYTGNGPWLVLVFNTSNGDQTQIVDLNQLIDVYTAGNGINIAGNVVSVKIDPASESYLTVGADGVKLSGVAAAFQAADATLQTELEEAIAAEESARTAADQTLTTNLSTVSGKVETNTTNIAANAAAIEAEETRATGVEAGLRSDLNTVSGKADTNAAAIADNAEAIEAEESARTQADQTLTTNLNAVSGQVSTNTSNIAANTTAIANETSARTAADEALDARVEAVEGTLSDYTDVTAQVTANKNAIDLLNGEEGTEGSVAHTAKGYADTAQANAISTAAADATSKANAAQSAATAVANTKVADVVAGDGIEVSTTTGTSRNATISIKLGENANLSGAILTLDNGLELDLSNLVIDCGTY